MRIDMIETWTVCERYALSGSRPSARSSADRAVEAMAFAVLVGGPEPPVPAMVTLDSRTPSVRHLGLQARQVADLVGEMLERNDWTLMPVPELWAGGERLAGRHEFVAWRKLDGETLFRLRVGRVGASWIELGAALAEAPEIGRAGLYVAERGGSVGGWWAVRRSDGLVGEAGRWRRRVDGIVAGGAEPTVSPGRHCRFCDVGSCAAREDDR